MKIELSLPAGASVTIKDKKGVVLATSATFGLMEIEPFFTTEKGQGEAIHGETKTAGGKVVDTFTMAVSGGTGRVTRREKRVVSAKPAIDKQ